MFTLISLFLWITPLDLFRFYKLISSTEAHNYLPDSDNDVCLLTLFRTTGLEKLSKGYSKKDPSKAIKLINKPVLENSLRIISMKESWELRQSEHNTVWNISLEMSSAVHIFFIPFQAC